MERTQDIIMHMAYRTGLEAYRTLTRAVNAAELFFFPLYGALHKVGNDLELVRWNRSLHLGIKKSAVSAMVCITILGWRGLVVWRNL